MQFSRQNASAKTKHYSEVLKFKGVESGNEILAWIDT